MVPGRPLAACETSPADQRGNVNVLGVADLDTAPFLEAFHVWVCFVSLSLLSLKSLLPLSTGGLAAVFWRATVADRIICSVAPAASLWPR